MPKSKVGSRVKHYSLTCCGYAGLGILKTLEWVQKNKKKKALLTLFLLLLYFSHNRTTEPIMLSTAIAQSPAVEK